MRKIFLCGATLALCLVPARAQTNGGPPASAIELANLSEQVRALTDQAGRLELRVAQLEHDNTDLHAKLDGQTQNAPAATVAQLNAAVADLNRLIQSTDQATRAQIAEQLKKLAEQTNAGFDALAKAQATRPVVQPTFGDDYPKDAILRYTVQKGDSLDVIVKKTGAKKQDIINANKLTAPYTIQLGQALLIPGGKLPTPAP